MRLTDRQHEVLRDASNGLIFWTQFTGGYGGRFIDANRNTISPTVWALIKKGLLRDVGTGVRIGGPGTTKVRPTDAGRTWLKEH